MTPGMQYGYHTQLYILCTAKLLQSLPYACKQGVVHHRRLVQGHGIKFMRKREHDMIVGAEQQILFPLLCPLLPFMTLTFGAVPVAAAIVADTYIAATIAGIYMTAQSLGTTRFERTQCFLLLCVQL